MGLVIVWKCLIRQETNIWLSFILIAYHREDECVLYSVFDDLKLGKQCNSIDMGRNTIKNCINLITNISTDLHVHVGDGEKIAQTFEKK